MANEHCILCELKSGPELDDFFFIIILDFCSFHVLDFVWSFKQELIDGFGKPLKLDELLRDEQYPVCVRLC